MCEYGRLRVGVFAARLARVSRRIFRRRMVGDSWFSSNQLAELEERKSS